MRKYSKDIYVDESLDKALVSQFSLSTEVSSETSMFDNDAISVTSFASVRIKNKKTNLSSTDSISITQNEIFDGFTSNNKASYDNNNIRLENKFTNSNLENNSLEEKQLDRESFEDIVIETTTKGVSPDDLKLNNDVQGHNSSGISESLYNKSNLNETRLKSVH